LDYCTFANCTRLGRSEILAARSYAISAIHGS
jgi:hypothetical protein